MDFELENALALAAEVPPDAGAQPIDDSVRAVLRLMREHLEMDVAFVSHLHEGRRYFVTVDTREGAEVVPEGAYGSAESSFCQRLIDGRLPPLIQDLHALPDYESLPKPPVPMGSHVGTPVVLNDGSIYGTLCCFSFHVTRPLVERDLKRLRMAASLVARLIDQRKRD